MTEPKLTTGTRQAYWRKRNAVKYSAHLAVQRGLKGSFVWRVVQGEAQMVPVQPAWQSDLVVVVKPVADGLKAGDQVVAGEKVDVKPGNAMPLRSMPVGTIIHNVELKPGRGAQIIRSAGSSGQLMAKEGRYAQVRLPSGAVRMVLIECRATVGQVGNLEHEIIRIGKAGRSRWLGIRPTVRGLAMNPVDHPHGGGEGKSGQGNPHPVSPWGQKTKGMSTRKNKRTDKFIVSVRRPGARSQ